MHDDDTPAQTGTGLSTDDIARSGEREPGPDTGREQEVRDTGAAPVYPGEAVGTGGADDAPGADAQTDRDMDADTGMNADRDADVAPVTEARSATGTDGAGGTGNAFVREADGSPRLMDPEEEESLRNRWRELQSLFVDDPRRAVHEADTLVADVMQKLATTFADHRKVLEAQWRQDGDVDTESLRTALRSYRSFFHRLLSTGAAEPADSGEREGDGATARRS
ncbi:hypothetical protein [Streptomyces sp. NPDC018711]|uniref:hypothetical protein n=1 Tax=Streptomyces sp. NPDC018711 TaxID=3365052 RepID=UPI0037B83BB0